MEIRVLPIVEPGPSRTGEGLLFQEQCFAFLNEDKGFELLRFEFHEGGERQALLAINFGRKGNELYSPFSAPFGGFAPKKIDLSIEYYDAAAQALKKYVEKEKIGGVNITLPADCYQSNSVPNQVFSLLSAGFELKYTDVNYSLHLNERDFEQGLKKIARRCLKVAENEGLEFIKCESEEQCLSAYQVIAANREQKGYPLKMSFESLLKVSEITEVDFFCIKKDDLILAGAVIFHISDSIGQVVYWGNDTNYNRLNPTHFLAKSLSEYYSGVFNVLDIGPSSDNGRPNIGLCRFKESIGCKTSVKHTLELKR